MQLTHVEAAVILGIVIPQISRIRASSACWAAVNTCMSDLCESEQAFHGGICNDEGCQIKGSEVCNMTIQTALDLFPSLQGCVCTWGTEEEEEEEEEEGDLCGSIQVLAEQCHRKPGAVFSVSLCAHDGAGSCFEQMKVCLGDSVCNKQLISVLEVCAAEPCDFDACQRAARHFYGSLPQNVAEMLIMCECDASDESCLQMKTSLHSWPCADEARVCQERVQQCLDDEICSDLLEAFRAKCWSSDNDRGFDGDLRLDECLASMEPALMFGADPECRKAFVETLGTVLHRPCSCGGVHNDDLRTCSRIHDVLHNRSAFMTSLKSGSVPSKPPEGNESERRHTWSHEYLLYAFATVLLVGVVVLMPLAVGRKIWMLKKRDDTRCHHAQKRRFVVVL